MLLRFRLDYRNVAVDTDVWLFDYKKIKRYSINLT